MSVRLEHPEDRSASRGRDVRRERFEAIFEERFRFVSAYVCRRAGEGEADDAVAETFVVAWRRLDEMPLEARPWLLGVARRVLANQRRAAVRRGDLTSRLVHESSAPAEPPEREPILQALAQLSDGDREILLLVAWEGLSTSEVAAVFGCSRAAAKVRLHRARRRLRDVFLRLDSVEPADVRKPQLEECHEK